MSYGQCIVIFRPKFLESDGIFCLVPLLVQQRQQQQQKDEKLGKTTLETSRGSHDQLENYTPQ